MQSAGSGVASRVKLGWTSFQCLVIRTTGTARPAVARLKPGADRTCSPLLIRQAPEAEAHPIREQGRERAATRGLKAAREGIGVPEGDRKEPKIATGLTRWEPFAELAELSDRLDRAFGNLIKADSNDGVLEVSIPVPAEKEAKRIQVKTRGR
jgi:hypothetical protein